MPHVAELVGGHVAVERTSAHRLEVTGMVGTIAISLNLSIPDAVSLGRALIDYAGEAFHPDACQSCGRVNAKTPGCPCGEPLMAKEQSSAD